MITLPPCMMHQLVLLVHMALGLDSGTLPPHPPLQSQQSDSGMSASSAIGNSGAAGPPCGSGKVTATRNKQTNFSAYEDNVICKSWLEIGCDPITNTGQRRESFWFRVCNRYNSQRGTYPKRSQQSINTRWDHIKYEVSKFSGYMTEMIRSNPSGLSDSDKDEPKWMELKRSMDMSKNNATRDATPHDSNSNTVDLHPEDSSPCSSTEKRPMGRDAAKVAKKKGSLASYEFTSKMHELSVKKIELFKETEVERKVRLDEIVSLHRHVL